MRIIIGVVCASLVSPLAANTLPTRDAARRAAHEREIDAARDAARAAAAAVVNPANSWQPDRTTPSLPVAGPSVSAVLRQGTSVHLITVERLHSTTTRVGDRFELRAEHAVMLDGRTVIPAGARGVGEVTRVVHKGAFGRSGKIDLRLLHVEAGDRRIDLTGVRRVAGQGNAGATVVAVILVGVLAAFVTGHSATLPSGTAMTGYLPSDVTVAVETRPVAALAD